MNKRILIGSPIHQKPNILKHFLKSLEQINTTNLTINYYFIDDNEDEQSSNILKNFAKKHKTTTTIKISNIGNKYICDENSHNWNNNLIWKVAEYKNDIIKYCIENEFDYLFLVDSDLILHPESLKHLISTNKDIISEIFWTKWEKGYPYMPQVWLRDRYDITPINDDEILTESEIDKRKTAFLRQLLIPGVYEVGGLGACTLIHKNALLKGVNFSKISNISFMGEDRHFCIRAVALGINLFVDTHFPAYHIYRESDIEGIDLYKKENHIVLEVEKELYGDQIEKGVENIVIKFINSYLSMDYRTYTGYEGLELLSAPIRNTFLKKKDEISTIAKNNKLKCNTKIIELNIDTTNINNGIINIKTKSQINIEDINGNHMRNSNVNLEICKDTTERWYINYISFYNDNNEAILGFTITDLVYDKRRANKSENNRLTLIMLVRNEANKFLAPVLSHVAKYIDNAIILDDASTDNTIQVCKQALKDIPHEIISNFETGFGNEINLRKQLWEYAASKNPDWILCLDADEIFEDSIIFNIKALINQPNFDFYSFRLYDMWDYEHYREDTFWQAHRYFRPFLVRYQPHMSYTWHETPQHCGRFPNNLELLNGCKCNIRLKHYGWVTPQLRAEKYKRYMKLDPDGIYGNINQYRSIFDLSPHLIKWE